MASRRSHLMLLAPLLAAGGTATSDTDGSAADADVVHWSRATRRVPVRAEPRPDAERIGLLTEQEVFAWTAPADGPGCERTTWALLVGGGFACLTDTTPSTEAPVPLPRRVHFDPPRPEEWDDYLQNGTWPRAAPTDEALLPYVYGKRWRAWDGALFASLQAWNEGAEPIDRLPAGGGRRSHFVEAVETERGAVLVRPDGRVVPVDRLHVYPVDRFSGRDLALFPVDEGWLPGWIIAYEGAELRRPDGQPSGVVLPYHQAVDVRPTVDGDWEVRHGLGPEQPGLLDDRRDMHHWVPAPAPEAVNGTDQLWVDVELDQQVLALRRGETVAFVTLISGGRTGRTPTGLYAVMDKSIHDDMRSRPDADDPYFVEEVPWVIHFRPRYAIHGAYWHWGFGHRASHGCVNLAPADAMRVFDAVSPALPDGWHTAWAHDGAPGSLVRIREGQERVLDRRVP